MINQESNDCSKDLGYISLVIIYQNSKLKNWKKITRVIYPKLPSQPCYYWTKHLHYLHPMDMVACCMACYQQESFLNIFSYLHIFCTSLVFLPHKIAHYILPNYSIHQNQHHLKIKVFPIIPFYKTYMVWNSLNDFNDNKIKIYL